MSKALTSITFSSLNSS
ncbi:hypothetical protein OIU84_029631, partial [Salix udensis]